MHTQKIILPVPYPVNIRQGTEDENDALKKENEELRNKLAELTAPKIKTIKGRAEYSSLKSDGKPKAQAAAPIRSYDDFKAMQNYFLERSQIRNWAFWTVGVSLGLRVSDLSALRVRHFLNDDGSFKERLKIIEQKTGKVNDILITESVVNAISLYKASSEWAHTLDDYLFASKKTKESISTRHGWRILSNAGHALNLPIHMGSHTMRKSFINIYASTHKERIDTGFIATAQYLCGHSDQRTTMRYMPVLAQLADKAREAVSDFILGKSDINNLSPITHNENTLREISTQLEKIQNMLTYKED